MENEIYINSEEGLLELSKSLFDSENVLQETLAENPELLAGEEMTPDSPRNWALVARETEVPDKEGGSERWSADHVFIDQDAVPTIVEVKRSKDSRIRRKVVGQMLDYASHARKYWEADGLRSRFETTHGKDSKQVYERLETKKGRDTTDQNYVREFWEKVESNLRSGNIRLLFVADEIPRELREIVEYLNEQMEDTEVFAVEVTRYEGETRSAYSPSLYGKTAGGSKGSSSTYSTPPSYEGDNFLGDVEAKEDAGDITTEEAEAMREIYRFIREEADDFEFGGSSNVTVKAHWEATAGSMFSLSSTGQMLVWMADKDFRDEEGEKYMAVQDWYEKLDELYPEADPKEKGRIYIEDLIVGDRVEQFKQACMELVSKCDNINEA
jgi:hypothetical protein